MHWFYGILIIAFIFYLFLKKLPEPPKDNETKTVQRDVNTSKTKKKKNKKTKAKAKAQIQEKLNQKIQKKNTPPKGKTNELDENEWPTLGKMNEEKKAAEKAIVQKQKENQIKRKNEFNIKYYDEASDDVNSNSNVDDNGTDDNEEYVRKSTDKPVVIQNVSLPVTNRRYKKHVIQENQKYISSDDEEISDGEIKVVRVVEKKEELEKIELPPEVDGWKNVVPKKANILVIKSASSPTPIVQKTVIRKPKEEPLTKKQKENRKKAEKKKIGKAT